MIKRIAPVIVALGFAGCGKKAEDKPAPAASAGTPEAARPEAARPEAAKPEAPSPAGDELDVAKLQVTASGWEGTYNKILRTWTYEKYTPGKDDTNEPNRVTFGVLPSDAPSALDDYATKLGEKDFQDFGYRYSAIAEKTKLADGWLITGTVQGEASDPAEPGFVMLRELGGTKLRCKSETVTSDKIRSEGIALCKSVKR